MINQEMVERLWEVGNETGAHLAFCLFDRRVLMPLSSLPDAVQRECGVEISEAGLVAKEAEGWFSFLGGAGENHDERGLPLYVISRIGLFLTLEREGWTGAELRRAAEMEEWMVDEVLTADDFTYLDDDLETLIVYEAARLQAASAGGSIPDRSGEIPKIEKNLAFLRGLREGGIPDRLKTAIQKASFRVRANNDITRVWLLDMDRGQLRAGYSPFVSFSGTSWSAESGFSGNGIRWRETIGAAIAHGNGEDLPIRIPGLLLREGCPAPSRPLRPAEYTKIWNENDLEGYLKTWADLKGERRCLNCYGPISPPVTERKRFCGDKCRNAAKQRRYRERNPEAAERAQAKYWRSLGDLETEGEPS